LVITLRTINEKTGEINALRIKGLWSHFPIPAYQVLAKQKAWQAQKVLTCLVSYLGDNGLAVWPSYDAIIARCGISRSGIRPALDVLEQNGFIKIGHWNEGKKERNKYYLQECCWDTSKMNKFAAAYRVPMYKCIDCGKTMDGGGYGKDANARKVHWGCGGTVVSLESINKTFATDYTELPSVG
jgi:hypothetical protein